MPTKKLLPILTDRFGEAEAIRIWQKALAEYESLLPMAQGQPKDRKKNMEESIFPFAAIYRVLLGGGGMDRDTAMDHMYAIMEAFTRGGMRKTYETAGKLPFFFPLFRKMFSTGLKGASWEVDFLESNKEHFFYDIHRCLWHEVCTELGCPELCKIFCRNDEINFVDVSPRLYFRRSSTLGSGGDCCDFRFYRHNPDGE